MVDGKPKYREESLKTTSQDRAERLRAQRQGQAEQGNLPEPRVKRTRFEDLRKHLLQRAELDGLKSIERIKDAISHLQTIFGTDRASAITVSRIQEYAHRRLTKEKAARASVNYELAILRRIFSLGRAAGLVVGGPKITLTRPHNARTGFFEDGDFQALKAQLPDELVAPAMFAYLTGWRFQSEVLPLTWRQVDFKAGEVRPYTSKNKEGRVFPFSALPALKKLLEEQRDLTSGLVSATGEDIPFVFHRHGERIKDFRGAWKAACKAAGLAGRLPHDFRRSAVRRLEHAGVPRSVAMQLTGHKTEAYIAATLSSRLPTFGQP